MKIEIPDDIATASGLTAEDCLIELAVHLYADRRMCLAQALRLVGGSRLTFEAHLAQRQISLYTVEDLHADVETLKELGRL